MLILLIQSFEELQRFFPHYIPLLGPAVILARVEFLFVLFLTAHNWQKWKRVFLTCPCHKIYRDEAVGLKSCKYTWKITIFVKMWNLRQYRLFNGITLKNLVRLQKLPRSCHITPLLMDLHWLRVSERIIFKTVLYVYKSLNGFFFSFLISQNLFKYVLWSGKVAIFFLIVCLFVLVLLSRVECVVGVSVCMYTKRGRAFVWDGVGCFCCLKNVLSCPVSVLVLVFFFGGGVGVS